MPRADEPAIFKDIEKDLEDEKVKQKYKIGCFWRFMHERLWTIRGMENLMMDYYDSMDELKKLGCALLEYYKKLVDRFAELGFDAIFTSDDLGHQTGPMMSPAIFDELFFPIYKEIIGYVHEKGMHFWLHTCGDNTRLLDSLIAAGLDVIHPIQKGCMDEVQVFEKYHNKITFLYGIDVQHLLPEGDPDDVKAEVRRIVDCFKNKNGGLIFAAGNGIMPDTPVENINAMLSAICEYGR